MSCADIETVYICLIVLWIVIIFSLGLYQTDIMGFLIMLLPLFTLAISLLSINSIEKHCEENIGRFNVIAFGILAATILINWHSNSPNQIRIRSLVVFGVLLLVISKIDIWTSRENWLILLHLRVGIQTFAMTIIAFALYEFYREISPIGTHLGGQYP